MEAQEEGALVCHVLLLPKTERSKSTNTRQAAHVTRPTNPFRIEERVLEALLDLADLPDGDWEIDEAAVPIGEDDPDDNPLFAAESCDTLRNLSNAFGGGDDDDDDDDPLAAREREFQQQSGLDLVQVGSEVSAYATARDFGAGELFLRNGQLNSDSVQQCFSDGSAVLFDNPEAPPIEIGNFEIVDVEAPVDDSFAFGIRLESTLAGFAFNLDMTLVQIARGNAIGELQILRANDGEIAVGPLAQALAKRMEDAQ
jgi:hypothetical protein